MALVSVSTVKQLGRIDTNAHDDLIAILIDSAQEYAFNYCSCAVATGQDIVDVVEGQCYLWLPSAPIYEVTEVKDLVNDVVLTADDYGFDNTKIWAKTDPFVSGDGAYQVTYKAGHNVDGTVPEAPIPSNLFVVPIAEMALRVYNNPDSSKRMSGAGTSREWQTLDGFDDIHLTLDRLSLSSVVS